MELNQICFWLENDCHPNNCHPHNCRQTIVTTHNCHPNNCHPHNCHHTHSGLFRLIQAHLSSFRLIWAHLVSFGVILGHFSLIWAHLCVGDNCVGDNCVGGNCVWWQLFVCNCVDDNCLGGNCFPATWRALRRVRLWRTFCFLGISQNTFSLWNWKRIKARLIIMLLSMQCTWVKGLSIRYLI